MRDPGTGAPALDEIRRRRDRLARLAAASERRMADTARALLAPLPAARGRAQSLGRLAARAVALYQGARLGLAAVSALRKMLGRKPRR